MTISSMKPIPVTSSAYSGLVNLVNATIAAAGNLSGTVDLTKVGVPVGLIMPAAWTAAVVTIQVSHNGTTFVNLRDRFGAEWSATVGVDRGVILDPLDFLGWSYIKVRSGTAASAVAQDAERVIGIVARPV